MIKRLTAWIVERWPLSALGSALLDERIPGGASFAYSLGSLVLLTFSVQALTGLLQLLYYVPTVGEAYNSLSFLRTHVPFGWLIHGLHFWGATAMVVLVLLHLTQVFLWGAYKRPRELTWLVGCALLLLVMGFSFTGSPLHWDQKGYWAAQVGTSIAGTIPVVGDIQKQLLRGGEAMGQLTLSRFFAVHVTVLPALLVALILVHLVAMRRNGVSGPWREGARSTAGLFWPDQAFKDLTAGSLLLLLLIALAALAPPSYSGPADVLDTAYVPKPDWNFLFLYESLKYFNGAFEPIGTIGVPTFLAAVLVLLPFLDRRPERNPFLRPIAVASGLVLAAVLIALSVAGYKSTGFAGSAAGSAGSPGSSLAAPPAARGAIAANVATGLREEPGSPGTAAFIIGNAARGGELFAQNCTGCHGNRGTRGVVNPGSADGTVPTLNPIDRRMFDARPDVFAESIDSVLQHGSVPEGERPILRMPAFGDSRSLTQPALANLEAYILEINSVDRAGLVDPGLRPGTFLLLVVVLYGLILLIAGGAWQKLVERQRGRGGERPHEETRE
jgi:ubiquinol-cytochrome c reductase cytochrome b subunit